MPLGLIHCVSLLTGNNRRHVLKTYRQQALVMSFPRVVFSLPHVKNENPKAQRSQVPLRVLLWWAWVFSEVTALCPAGSPGGHSTSLDLAGRQRGHLSFSSTTRLSSL